MFSCKETPHLKCFKDLVYHSNILLFAMTSPGVASLFALVQIRSTPPEITGAMLDKNGMGWGLKLLVFLFLSVSYSDGKDLQPPRAVPAPAHAPAWRDAPAARHGVCPASLGVDQPCRIVCRNNFCLSSVPLEVLVPSTGQNRGIPGSSSYALTYACSKGGHGKKQKENSQFDCKDSCS